MSHAVHSAVSGGLSALERLDALTNNLANASTPGFKAQLVVQRARAAAHAHSGAAAVATPITRGHLETDFSQGSLETTGDPLHFAISGPGFFVIETEAGERLTRRGSFSLDAQGFLVTAEGERVQGDGGDLALGDAVTDEGPIHVAPDGTIEVGRNRIGRLRVVTVADPQALVREGASRFAAPGQTLEDAPDGGFVVRQGALERSNASPITNLVALIETLRGFEAYMTATTRLDQVNERAIADVARV